MEDRRQEYEATRDEMYTCNSCHKEQVGSEFPFSPGSSPNNGRRALSMCRSCSRTYNRERAARLREEKRVLYDATADEMFTCGTCGEEKPGSKFPFSTSSAGGRALTTCYVCNNTSTRARIALASHPVLDIDGPPTLEDRSSAFDEKQNGQRRDLVTAKVKAMIDKGILTKPLCCELCGDESILEFHHWKSISDMTYHHIASGAFLCRPCHLKAHDGHFSNPPLHPFALAQSVIETKGTCCPP